jgi:hypothetical protein
MKGNMDPKMHTQLTIIATELEMAATHLARAGNLMNKASRMRFENTVDNEIKPTVGDLYMAALSIRDEVRDAD